MYERFSDRGRRVMQLANQEAQRFNHEYIGTEHILLGLVREGSGVDCQVLRNLDIDLRRIRLEVAKLAQSGPDMVTMGKLPITPAAKRVIKYAEEESWKLKLNQVDTGHILLGLLRENGGVASQILMNLGLRLDEVRKEIEKVLRQPNDLEKEPCVSYAPAQSAVQADEGAVEPPQACPKCGHSPVVCVIWAGYYLSDKDLKAIQSGQALLGSLTGGEKGLPWVCLQCVPKWSKVHDLAMQDYKLQLEKEKAIESQDFEKAAQCLRSQRGSWSRLSLLYEELSRDQ